MEKLVIEKALIDKTAEQAPRDCQPAARAAHTTQWIGIALLLAALLLYGLTLDNGLRPGELEGGDLITHQYAQVQARPSNAPGYPLYTMGGWLWFHTIRGLLQATGSALPNPLPILSSYSTLWALVALWLLYWILCRITRSVAQPAGNGRLAGLLCAFYAVTYFFWYYATTTEQYSSAIAQTLAIVYLYLWWQAQTPGRDASHSASTASTKPIIGLAFLCGVALAHMLTVAFIVPPLVLVILWQAPYLIRSLRVVVGSVLAAALPLVSYLYIYWRGVAHPEWWGSAQWASPQAWFWSFVSTAQGREELGWGLGSHCALFDNGFPMLIWQELSIPIVLLGLIGIACLERRQATLLYGACVIYLIFCWLYRCGNWFQVILPVYPLLLIGMAALLHRAQQANWGRGVVYRGALIVLLLAIGWRFSASLPAADSRDRAEDSAFDHAAALLAQPLPAQAPLFAAVSDALALQYLSAIWGVRPDVQSVDSRAAAHLLAVGQPVYSTWEAAPTLRAELPVMLATTQQAIAAGWIAFYPAAPAPLSASRTISDPTLLPGLLLHGYRVEATAPSPLAAYRRSIAEATQGFVLTLFWRPPEGAWPEGVSISVRPLQGNQPVVDGAGGHIQQDRQQPAVGLYQVAPGQPIIDPYHFPLADTTQATVTQVQVLLYRITTSGFENLAEVLLPVADK